MLLLFIMFWSMSPEIASSIYPRTVAYSSAIFCTENINPHLSHSLEAMDHKEMGKGEDCFLLYWLEFHAQYRAPKKKSWRTTGLQVQEIR